MRNGCQVILFKKLNFLSFVCVFFFSDVEQMKTERGMLCEEMKDSLLKLETEMKTGREMAYKFLRPSAR